MNKTITITLNGIVFNVEEGAYKKLNEYLNSVKDHFSSSEDSAEILSDIEASIAEKFQDKISSKNQVIGDLEIDELISVMGEVDEFEDEDNELNLEAKKTKKNIKSNKKVKRLYRDTDDVVIAGVCSGVAAYFGIDPVIVRIIFVALIFAEGFGILLYFILWLAMPKASNSLQKLEMKGSIITIDKIKETVEKGKEVIKENESTFRKIISFPISLIRNIFELLAKLIKRTGPILMAIFGSILTISFSFLMIVMTVVFGILLFNVDTAIVNSDLAIQEIAYSMPYSLMIFFGYFIAVIPVFFLFLLSLVLIKRKNIFTTKLSLSLLGIWVLSIVVCSITSVNITPQIMEKVEEYKNLPVVEKKYDLKDFNEINVSRYNNVNVKQGKEFSVLVKGREMDLEKTKLEIKDKSLQINRKNNNRICVICLSKAPEIEITMPELNKFNASGGSRSSISGFENENFEMSLSGGSRSNLNIVSKKISINLSGSSRIILTATSSESLINLSSSSRIENSKLIVDNLNLNLSGSSRVELNGDAKILKSKLSGSSRIYLFDFPVNSATLNLSSSSRAEVNVSSKLNVRASGSSRVHYLGNPELNEVLSGSSRTSKANEKEEGVNSDLIEFEDDVVVLEAQINNVQEKVKFYIRENISDISIKKAVLGGKFYVTEVEFQEDEVLIEYEDGHIRLKASLDYIIEDDNVEIVSFELLED